MLRLAILLTILLAVATPALANCQMGGAFCGDPVAINCNGGVVCFYPWKLCSGCSCTTTLEGQTCLDSALLPGAVGASLHVDKSGQIAGDLTLTWGATCSGSSPDYSVEEGTLGQWYSHEPLRCSTGGALLVSLTPSGGDRYYLIAPWIDPFTGSLGTTSSGAERPDGSPSCSTDRALAACP